MQKYLAIIHDSFREAIASRVMWLVLVVITITLVAIAPFGFREVLTTRFSNDDLRRPDDFLEKVRQHGSRETPSPARQVWTQLSDKTQERLEKVVIPPRDNPFEYLGVLGAVVKEVNGMLQRPEFYDEEAWKGVRLSSDEALELRRRAQGQGEDAQPLSDMERARFHRLLLEAGFPDIVRSSPPTSVQFTYAWMDAASPQPLRGSTVREWVESLTTTLLGMFVGAIGVFVAILVTAPIIPQMFDAGSLHLLLSKPISRWLLFLAKFFGGCAFILIAAAYLIFGLWLILGVRFSIWEPRLLLSIPIYLFVFAVYYAVSALAAVLWRSPIVSIACAVLFWLVCFGVGVTKSVYENVFLNKERFTTVFYAQDTLIAADEFGWGKVWDPQELKWRERFVLNEQRQARPFLSLAPAVPREFRTVGPIYDADHDRILAAIPAFPPTKTHFAVGTRKEKWEAASVHNAPLGTVALLREPNGKILIASSLGLSRLVGDPLAKAEPVSMFGFTLPALGGNVFQNANPDPPILLAAPAAAAMDPVSGQLALYTRGKITLLSPQRLRYEVDGEHRLDGSEQQSVVMALAANVLLVGREDGRVQALQTPSFELIDEWRPEEENPPRFIQASADGRWFSIVFHTGHLWLYDATKRAVHQPAVTGQGRISAANFHGPDRLLVVDRTDRVSEYQLDPLELQQRFSPRSGLLLNLYRYALVPLYVVFPKPGELDDTLDYLLSGKKTEKSEGEADLTSAQQVVHPWAPVWSSGLFIVVVLGIACVYLEWQDF